MHFCTHTREKKRGKCSCDNFAIYSPIRYFSVFPMDIYLFQDEYFSFRFPGLGPPLAFPFEFLLCPFFSLFANSSVARLFVVNYTLALGLNYIFPFYCNSLKTVKYVFNNFEEGLIWFKICEAAGTFSIKI